MAESLKEFAYKVGIVFTLGGLAMTHAINSDPAYLEKDKPTVRQSLDQDNYQTTPQEFATEQENTANIPQYTEGYITRESPRARYLIVQDPHGLGRKCVQKTNESPANTLIGMTVVVAGDPNTYDGAGTIYDSSGTQIGYWTKEKLISFNDLSAPAYADSVACANN